MLVLSLPKPEQMSSHILETTFNLLINECLDSFMARLIVDLWLEWWTRMRQVWKCSHCLVSIRPALRSPSLIRAKAPSLENP